MNAIKKKGHFERTIERDSERKRTYWARINRVVEYVRRRGEAKLEEIVAYTGVPRYFIVANADVIENTFPDILIDSEGTFYCRDTMMRKVNGIGTGKMGR